MISLRPPLAEGKPYHETESFFLALSQRASVSARQGMNQGEGLADRIE